MTPEANSKACVTFSVLLFMCLFLPTAFCFAEADKAPDFSAKDMNGSEVSLAALKGRVVLLCFWATWCSPCKDEMPRFNIAYREMKSRGLEVVAVSTDYSIGLLKQYVEANRFEFAIVYDEKRAISRQYKVSYLPVTFLIDKSGHIVERIAGEFEWPSADMKEKLEKLLR